MKSIILLAERVYLAECFFLGKDHGTAELYFIPPWNFFSLTESITLLAELITTPWRTIWLIKECPVTKPMC